MPASKHHTNRFHMEMRGYPGKSAKDPDIVVGRLQSSILGSKPATESLRGSLGFRRFKGARCAEELRRNLRLAGFRSTYSHDFNQLVFALRLCDAVNRKCGTTISLLSSFEADVILTGRVSPRNTGFFGHFSAHESLVNQLAGYTKDGKPFEEELVYAQYGKSRLVLPTQRHKGEEKAAIIVTGLTLDELVRDGKDWVVNVPEDRLALLRLQPWRSEVHVNRRGDLETTGSQEVTSKIGRGFCVASCNTYDDKGDLVLKQLKYLGPVYRNGSYEQFLRSIVAYSDGFNSFSILVRVPEEDVRRFGGRVTDARKMPPPPPFDRTAIPGA